MSYTKVEFGALMLENKDGTPKDQPFVYRPFNRPPVLTIPPAQNDHARPILRLTGEGIKPMVLMFHQDGITAKCGDEIRKIASFDFDAFKLED